MSFNESAWETSSKTYTRKCGLEGCDVEFTSKHSWAKYCSVEHRTEARRRNSREASKKIPRVKPAPKVDTSLSASYLSRPLRAR